MIDRSIAVRHQKMLNGGEVVGAANDENVVSNGHDRTSFCESLKPFPYLFILTHCMFTYTQVL
jgi:hypothetical protein